ncbi:LodA/GoxA family CTQ-dependent oxidase [Pseudomonas ovata]|uniref:LodA/GoxA family CTQ-dependent oxidase n=1 Tax=Pseudomonas ovata TaxID=1839709 RepID=UPI0019D4A78A|nr:LodA/GoxA family CTQ-dependent oxidase [Pseudomonas ovata]
MNMQAPQQSPSNPDLSRIVRAAIHPGIGIARLGNSREADGFFIGPETVDLAADALGDVRDVVGALKRQAARFRIYGYDAEGQVVTELTADQAQIDWQVHLVNRKAQWFKFDMAMDLEQAAHIEVALRNEHLTGAAREALVIDPGVRSITGKNNAGEKACFDSGEFMGIKVPLGELRTDSAGRLLVLGGFAQSGSPSGRPIYDPDEPGSFPNASEWFDDTSDGPVRASVILDGRHLPVESAWVVAAQPSFAPHAVGWRTLYDLLVDTYIGCGWIKPAEQVSFQRDVLPVLQRLSGLQWVNKGFAGLFGHGAPMDFNNPHLLARLSCADETYRHLRRAVFNAFRAADNDVHEPRTWPWLYGDTYGGDDDLPANHLAPSSVRSDLLRRWVDGDFIDDWQAASSPVDSLDKLPLAQQPAMLDRAALHFCVADAFHPGIELSWPMRHASLYRAPFRIRERAGDQPLPDYGSHLDQPTALGASGPLHDQPPGGLSRWMALPWQIDAVGCRSGYDKDYDPYLPTFWPAQVPNQVLSEADYAVVIDGSRSREQRLASFHSREHWGRQVKGNFIEKAMQVVEDASVLGVLEVRPGIADDTDFPAVMHVEVERSPGGGSAPDVLSARDLPVPEQDAYATDEARRLAQAGWDSAGQYEEFCRILRR